MDLDKLEKLANLVLRDLKLEIQDEFYLNSNDLKAKLINLLDISSNSLPDHQSLFSVPRTKIYVAYGLSNKEAISLVNHLLEIIELEKEFKKTTKKFNIFDSANEKINQAGSYFQKTDYHSVFSSLNTAFELLLKDKIGIPTTITGINTANIVEVLVKHKVEPYLYFKEVRKRVTDIDNKVKHQSYSPSKIDAINGIRAMEDLILRLKNKELNLTQEVKNKICEGL